MAPGKDSFQAVTRFGLGASGNDLAAVSDPRSWLLAQLRAPSVPPEIIAAQPGDYLTKQTDKKNSRMLMDAQGNSMSLGEAFKHATHARFGAQVTSRQPFIERLTMFWGNHFTVSIQKGIIAGFATRFEVEAIRPYLTGYFKDMLLATARHPAMLLYLDNAQSIGPNSAAGMRNKKGLNENYAREVMELHTLGVDGGYTQADVTALATMLTGWSLKGKDDTGEKLMEYQFQPKFHEPGEKIWLNHRVPEMGENEGIAALDLLATHPATARHLATRFARYFISDTPPPSAIDALAKSFLQSNGHLGAMTQTLINLPDAWATPLTKFKDPYDYILSLCRMLGFMPDEHRFLQMLNTLDYRPFNAPSPEGYPTSVESWASPDSVNKRIEFAYNFVQQLPDTFDPMQLATATLGPVLSDSTAQTIRRAASGKDGIALLLSSPEFLRR